MNVEDLRLKRFGKTLIIITLMSLSLVLVACSNDNNSDAGSVNEEGTGEETGENPDSETTEQMDSDQEDGDVDNSTDTLASAKIRGMTDCILVTTALGDFAKNYELDDFHFDDEGFSCFYVPNKINEETGEESGYITVIGKYSASMFETAEELEEHEIYDVYNDKRVESFGGVAFGLNEQDGNDVVTQIKTQDFDLTLNVTGDRIDLMYGEPSIDVLLELIEMD